jgi:hypothetical protein
VQLGLRFKAVENLSITPGADLLLNAVAGDESFINTIILPSVAARYAITQGDSFYVEGAINFGIVNTGGNIDAKSGGVGFSGAVGYAFASGFGLEAGYLRVPVEIAGIGRHGKTTDENFGGFMFRVKMAF